MRACLLSMLLLSGVLMPAAGTAQITYTPTPKPEPTAAAAGAAWQATGAPIFFAGSYYYPSGPTVHFDGQLMTPIGVQLGVPLYANVTHEAFSVVLVPIGGALMRPYERPRTGRLAGTVGSTTPSWPVQVAADVSRPRDAIGAGPEVMAAAASIVERPGPTPPEGALGTAGGITAAGFGAAASREGSAPARNTGISIEFDGARWISDGPAVAYSAGRFVLIGEYYGFPVYRASRGGDDTIYVTVVPDGPLAPYTRR